MKKYIFAVILQSFVMQLHCQNIITIDGDTFKKFDSRLNKYVTYRIANIDAPEKSQLFGDVAAALLDSLLNSGRLNLKIFNVDRYGRTIAVPYVSNIRVDSFLVSCGLAFVFYKYSIDKICINAEFYARSNGLYVWSIKNYIYPWEWRQIKKTLPKVKFKLPFFIN